MLLFLDTEFTDFAKPDLISIALVGEDGREFYAELNDYQRDNCNNFVRKTVLPLLGRVPGATCNRAELTRRLRVWFDSLPEKTTIIYDFAGDWLLLSKAMFSRQQQLPPTNFGEPLHLDNFSITHPLFEQALNFTYTQDWPPHHAMADARALMAGYRAWRAFMEPIWRIQKHQPEAAKAHLAAGRAIYYGDQRYPGQIVKEYPDGRRQLVDIDEKSVVTVIKEIQ